ncbi:MAG: rhodanese-like domain-containing protein [Bacteroidales bacterium]
MSFLSRLFGGGTPDVNFKELVANGAMIVDVRTKEEYRDGGVKGAVNIPLDQLGNHLQELPKDKAIILYCASGMRSSAACTYLKKKGYTQIYNGRNAASLLSHLK